MVITTPNPITLGTLQSTLQGVIGGITMVQKTHNKIPQHLQVHKSTVQNPVKFFWGNIQQVVQSGVNTRSGIINHFVNLGVSYYTVRTQYQIWYGLNKNNTTTV